MLYSRSSMAAPLNSQVGFSSKNHMCWPDRPRQFQDASNALISRGIKIRVVYRTAQIDRSLALVAAGVGLSYIPASLGTPAVKLVQVAEWTSLERTVSCGRANERTTSRFIKFAESLCWPL